MSPYRLKSNVVAAICRGSCEVQAETTAYHAAGGDIAPLSDPQRDLAKEDRFFVHRNTIQVPFHELWVSNDARQEDLLVWCLETIEVSDAKKLYAATQAAGDVLKFPYPDIREYLQNRLGAVYGEFDLLKNQAARTQAQIQICSDPDFGTRFPGLRVTGLTFFRICTPQQHTNSMMRWFKYQNKILHLIADWRAADPAGRDRYDHYANRVIAKMERRNLVTSSELRGSGGGMELLRSLFVPEPETSQDESQEEDPCDVCRLPLTLDSHPGECLSCKKRVHPWHMPPNKSRCYACEYLRRRSLSRSCIVVLVGAILIAVGLLIHWVTPRPLSLFEGGYSLFHDGWANGWIPQYFMVGSRSFPTADYDKVLQFRIVNRKTSAPADKCLKLNFRVDQSPNKWIGVAWTQCTPEDLLEGTDAAVNLMGATFIEFDAWTDLADFPLSVEFKACVTGNDAKIHGDSSPEAIQLTPPATLTPCLQHFQIPVGNADLKRVVTAFYLGVAQGNQSAQLPAKDVTVYLDNIRWTFPNGQSFAWYARTAVPLIVTGVVLGMLGMGALLFVLTGGPLRVLRSLPMKACGAGLSAAAVLFAVAYTLYPLQGGIKLPQEPASIPSKTDSSTPTPTIVGADAATTLAAIKFIAYSPSTFDPRPASVRQPSRPSLLADLQLIHMRFDGLIVYSCNPPTADVVEVAAAEDFRGVILGVWDPLKREEMETAVHLTGKYPNIVKAICIGNEGLQFGRYTLDDLQQAFVWMREQTPCVPLTTSEPISRYGNQTLQALPDFHAPNIHPFFDMAPDAEMSDRVAWVIERASALAKVTGKFVLCKETGWPSAGDDRCSPELQRQFWSELKKQTGKKSEAPVAFATFEAFDLPWKAEAAGQPTEGHWGLYTSAREPKSVVSILPKVNGGVGDDTVLSPKSEAVIEDKDSPL